MKVSNVEIQHVQDDSAKTLMLGVMFSPLVVVFLVAASLAITS